MITPINYKDGVIYFGTQYFFWHGLQSSEPLHVIMNGFDLRNKKFIFRYKIINQRKISFPIIYKDRIVFATNHFVIALDSNTGKRKWIKISKSNYISELIPVKDGVGYYYENINTSSILHAIDIETGMDVLTLNFDFPIVGIPSIDEKNIYLISYNGSLLSIDRINGNIKWIKSNLKPIYNSLTIVRDTIYLVNENSICVLNKDNGDIIWQGKEKVDMPVYSLIPSDKILIVPNFFEIYIYRSE
ncbi:MAG: PQQ-binding-like beta-propeller repeat protein [Caldisericia bacterium]|nr:PQQ-binding-like beta-propeller repeat protein [Caldisericia bacterium]